MHTVETFVAEYPEFAAAPVELVAAKLAQAARSIDETVWGAKAVDGHGLLAADLLARSPFGAAAGLAQAGLERRTVYLMRYEDLVDRVGAAYRVVL